MCMQSISNDCKESGLGGLYIFGNEAHTNLSLVSFFMLDLVSGQSSVQEVCWKARELFTVHMSAFDLLYSLRQII